MQRTIQRADEVSFRPRVPLQQALAAGWNGADAVTRPKSNKASLFKWLLFAQLGVATLQLPIRALIYDFPFMADLMVALMLVACWVLWTTNRRQKGSGFTLLDVLFGGYFVYGALCLLAVVLANTVASNLFVEMPRLESFLPQWRATFFPVSIFFVARTAIREATDIYRFMFLFKIIAIVLIVDVFCEFIWIQVLGFPSGQIPWYAWLFVNDTRFLGNLRGNTPIAGASDPIGFTAVVGILGWSNYTSAAVAALALLLRGMATWDNPQVQAANSVITKLRSLLTQGNTWLIVGLVCCLLIIGNRTPIIALILGFLLMTPRRVSLRALIILPLVIGAILAVPVLSEAVQKMYELGFVYHEGLGGRSELTVILENWGIEELGRSPSVYRVMFGDLDMTNRTLGENRIVHYSLSYGLIWLTLFLSMFGVGLSYCWRLMRRLGENAPLMNTVGAGLFGLLFVYLIDSIHYSSTMVSPHTFYWSAALGVLSTVWSTYATETDEGKESAGLLPARSGESRHMLDPVRAAGLRGRALSRPQNTR